MLGSGYSHKLSCSNCCQRYDCSKVSGVPFYLHCGCTFCSSCLRRLSSRCMAMKCPNCRMITPLKPGCALEAQLIPDIYLMGLVMANALKLDRNPAKDSWLWRELALKPLPQNKSLPLVVKCEECLLAAAAVRCTQCGVDYCVPCDQQIHAAGLSLRRHTSIPITRAQSSLYACIAHPEQTKHYYCRQDRMLVCSECALNGEHMGHDTCGVTEAADELRVEVKSLLLSAERVRQKAAKSGKMLTKQLPLMQSQVRGEVESVAMYMPTVHSALQRKELALYSQLADSFHQYAKPCIQAHTLLEEHKVKVQTVIRTATEALKDDFELVTKAKSLLADLESVRNFPSHIDIGSCGSPRVPVDKERVAAFISSLAELQVEGAPARPTLFSDHDVQVDYISDADEAPPLSSLHPPGPPNQRCKSSSPGHEQLVKNGRLVRSASPYIKSPGKVSQRSPSNPPTCYKRSQSPPGLARVQTSPRKANGHRVSFSPPPARDLVEVVVSHVESPSELYVQEKEAGKRLESLQESVNRHCREEYRPLTESGLRAGVQCGARFSVDHVWYRAVLDEVSTDKSYVVVHFIDYGNSEPLPPTCLCWLPPALRVVPPLATRCALHRLQPPVKGYSNILPSWKSATIEYLRELLTAPVKMQVLERTDGVGLLKVDVFIEGNKSVREKLMLKGLAVLSSKQAAISPLLPPPMTLAKGDELSVFLSVAQTPGDFYVRDTARAAQRELQDLEKTLERVVAAGQLHVLGILQEGMWTCAKFQEDGKFYRAKVVRVAETGVTVQFIDYGNSAVVSLDEVYQLPFELMNTKTQAIRCKLHGVCPPDGGEAWPEDSSDYFEEIMSMEDPIIITSMGGKGVGQGEPLPVNVKVGKEDAAIAMIAKGRGESVRHCEVVTLCDADTTHIPLSDVVESPISQLSSSSIPTPPPSVSPAVATPPPPVCLAEATPPPPMSPAVATPPPSVSLAEATPPPSVSPAVTTPPPAVATPPPSVSPAVAMSPVVATSSLESLGATPPPSRPALATPPPSGPVVATHPPSGPAVATPPPSGPAVATPCPAVTMPSSQSPVATPLSADPLAAPTSPPAALPSEETLTFTAPLYFPPRQLPAVGDVIVCKVVHVLSPRWFHVVCIPDFVSVMAELRSVDVSGGGIVSGKEEWEIGQAALAEFEGSWHRVQYLSLIEEGYHEVFYVDFGNQGLVGRLAPIPPHLCTDPPQALDCSLAGGEASSIDHEAFCNMVAEKVLHATVQEVSHDGILSVTLTPADV